MLQCVKGPKVKRKPVLSHKASEVLSNIHIAVAKENPNFSLYCELEALDPALLGNSKKQ